jgi:hypothetical protein
MDESTDSSPDDEKTRSSIPSLEVPGKRDYNENETKE